MNINYNRPMVASVVISVNFPFYFVCDVRTGYCEINGVEVSVRYIMSDWFICV